MATLLYRLGRGSFRHRRIVLSVRIVAPIASPASKTIQTDSTIRRCRNDPRPSR